MKVSDMWKIAAGVIAVLFVIATAWQTVLIVPEGHVGIITHFGKAKTQVYPGLNFKTPWVENVRIIEIRQRKNTEKLAAATNNQLPITALVSINWTVNADNALEIYKSYGTLDQFEDRILDPKLRSVAKAALSKFRADELIRDRNKAAARIQTMMADTLANFPVTVNSPQIENIDLPQQYLDAVQAKEKARENAEREKHVLAQQRLQAMQKVNTAEAERDALKAAADGRAYAILTEAKAEADAIRVKGEAEAATVHAITEALKTSPQLVEYERAKRWNGQLPHTMMGQGTNVLWNMAPPPQ